MARLEAIIGKEEGRHRLLVKVGHDAFTVGGDQSVPRSVSRAHCRLTVDFSDDAERRVKDLKLQNLKAQNITCVDGLEIEVKAIGEYARVQLGFERYQMDLRQVLAGMRKLLPPFTVPPKYYCISQLRTVWENYDKTRLGLQLAEQKRNNLRGLGGIFSTAAILLAFIPSLGALRFVAMGISLVLGLCFFFRGFNSKCSLAVKLHDLDEDFRKKYVCPNPECRHFLGNVPYDVLRQNKGCGFCKCRYSE